MQSHALFQNNFKFCTFLLKFSNILPFFNISLPFFWKIAPIPLLSRIGPDTSDMQHRHYFFLARSALPEFFITSNLVCYKQDLQNLISWMEIAFFISTFHSTSDGYTGPNAGWFSQQWLFMGKRKLMPKKLKTKNLFWINRRNSKTDSNIYI